MTNPISDPLVENVISQDVAAAPVSLEATEDGVATVTLGLADRRAPFDGATVAKLTEIFETLQGAEGVRIVFVRGAQGAFSCGADTDWMRTAADWSEDDNRQDALALAHLLKSLSDIPVPTVALVEGAAYGAAAGLVAACDMAIATADATFAFTDVKLGAAPAVVSPYVIRAVGARAATALFVTGRPVDAAHALAIGLLQDVFADAAALDAAKAALAAEIATGAPGAVADAKQLVRDVEGRPLDRSLIEETARRLAKARVSEEGREGLAALVGGRAPAWTIR